MGNEPLVLGRGIQETRYRQMRLKPRKRTAPSAQGQINRILGAEKARNANRGHNQLCGAILEYLAFKRIPASLCDASASFNRQGRFMPAKAASGWPDIVACVPCETISGLMGHGFALGQFIGIEVKTGSSKPRKNQEEAHAAIRAAGGIVIVARSLDDVMDVLR